MYIPHDIIDIIESYTRYYNLYNFINNNGNITVHCDNCYQKIQKWNNNNKMIYELQNFNNNLIDQFKLELTTLSELHIINDIFFLNIKYHKIHKIFCNLCLKHDIGKGCIYDNLIYSTCDYLYISQRHFNIIKLNDFFFHKDTIENFHRLSYSFCNDGFLYLNVINCRHDIIFNLSHLSPFYKIKKFLSSHCNKYFKY
jgi:hypothetical protein